MLKLAYHADADRQADTASLLNFIYAYAVSEINFNILLLQLDYGK